MRVVHADGGSAGHVQRAAGRRAGRGAQLMGAVQRRTQRRVLSCMCDGNVHRATVLQCLCFRPRRVTQLQRLPQLAFALLRRSTRRLARCRALDSSWRRRLPCLIRRGAIASCCWIAATGWRWREENRTMPRRVRRGAGSHATARPVCRRLRPHRAPFLRAAGRGGAGCICLLRCRQRRHLLRRRLLQWRIKLQHDLDLLRRRARPRVCCRRLCLIRRSTIERACKRVDC